MAPVKPMGVDSPSQPKTKPGVTGFVQKYNEEGPKTSDLNPDVVTADSVLPTAAKPIAKKPGARRSKK